MYSPPDTTHGLYKRRRRWLLVMLAVTVFFVPFSVASFVPFVLIPMGLVVVGMFLASRPLFKKPAKDQVVLVGITGLALGPHALGLLVIVLALGTRSQELLRFVSEGFPVYVGMAFVGLLLAASVTGQSIVWKFGHRKERMVHPVSIGPFVAIVVIIMAYERFNTGFVVIGLWVLGVFVHGLVRFLRPVEAPDPGIPQVPKGPPPVFEPFRG